MSSYVAVCQVLSVDAKNRLLYVTTKAQQTTGIPVRVLHHGVADPLFIHATPLPRPGTSGLVCFTHGTSVNGVWLGAILANQVSAIGLPLDPIADYHSHPSGAFSILAGSGEFTHYQPDGSYLRVASNTALPNLTRNIVDENQVQKQKCYTPAERINSPISPFNFLYSHGSGTTITIAANGDVAITHVGGNTSILLGSSDITINASSSVNINTPVATASGSLLVGDGATGNTTDTSGQTTEFVSGIAKNIF